MRRTVQNSATVVRGCHLYRRVARRERERQQKATGADWLKRARDFKCAEPPKTRQHSCVPTTLRRVIKIDKQIKFQATALA
jgi:hypothetical protein